MTPDIETRKKWYQRLFSERGVASGMTAVLITLAWGFLYFSGLMLSIIFAPIAFLFILILYVFYYPFILLLMVFEATLGLDLIGTSHFFATPKLAGIVLITVVVHLILCILRVRSARQLKIAVFSLLVGLLLFGGAYNYLYLKKADNQGTLLEFQMQLEEIKAARE